MFCRDPLDKDIQTLENISIENALDVITEIYGEYFLADIQDKSVLDFGCGYGNQAVKLALSGARYACGIDISSSFIEHAIQLSREFKVEDKTRFLAVDPANYYDVVPKDEFDIVFSLNSFEHYTNPLEILNQFKHALRPDGRAYITFGPPWYHPYGAHCHFFSKLPWIHFLFSEKTVMKVRSRYRDDNAQKYSEVEGGLNQMSLRKFRKLVFQSDFKFELFELKALKNFDFLCRIPVLKELFTSSVISIISLNE